MTDNYEVFKKQILSLTGIDLNSYKENQMKRRIDSLILRNKVSTYSDYISIIRNDRDKFEEFVTYLTINVSEFWRNPDQWDILEKQIIPNLTGLGTVKIWSAACSTGDEPYSAAMLFNKYFPFDRIHITATDLDKQVLKKAKEGIYEEKSLKGLPIGFKHKFFRNISETSLQISDEVKRCVLFKEHNLLKDPYPDNFDLIMCRNVLIYFTDDAKNHIYEGFNRALKKGGYLFLGTTEQILKPAEFGFTSVSSFFYKKV
ncbi:MAG: protein-glutamate O-methyltransferase CheR [Lachnospiraceae bacterium]|nr:protein-glutamate O-methyltransferase CheR [Lachnospiraceae bacterium]